jgi:hypothetical protein
MDRFAEFEKKIKKSPNTMDAKTNFLLDGITGLKEAFKDFNEEITDFMAFTPENYADHEKRITAIEKKIK